MFTFVFYSNTLITCDCIQSLQEDQELGHIVLHLEVSDDDLQPNGPPFSYDIVDGNDDLKFMVDRNGIVSTASKFDRNIKDMYKLTIRVFDNGSPPLYSDTIITVKVIEESAFPPVVTPLTITVTVQGDTYGGGVIGNLKAEDSDPYDTLSYDIVSNNNHLFYIHSNNGNIKALQTLDAGTYRINISVSDGKFLVYTEVRLTIATIMQEMADNAVVIRFQSLPPEEFVSSYKDNLIRTLAGELSVRSMDIFMLSIQPASNEIITPARQKRSDISDLDVLLAVRKSPNNYYRGNSLRRKVQSAQQTIENNLGVRVVQIFNDVCPKDACVEGVCKTVVLFQEDGLYPIITESESFVTTMHQMSYKCECRRPFIGKLIYSPAGYFTSGLYLPGRYKHF